MSRKTAIITGIIVVLVIVGFIIYSRPVQNSNVDTSESVATTTSSATSSVPKKTGTIGSKNTPEVVPAPQVSTTTTTTQKAESFLVQVDEKGSSLTTISVHKGWLVTIKFVASTQNVPLSGIEFTSDIVNTGLIAPGQSNIVTFTTDRSFDFTSNWAQANTNNHYTIHINAQ